MTSTDVFDLNPGLADILTDAMTAAGVATDNNDLDTTNDLTSEVEHLSLSYDEAGEVQFSFPVNSVLTERPQVKIIEEPQDWQLDYKFR